MDFTTWQQPARGANNLGPTSLLLKLAVVEIKSKCEEIKVKFGVEMYIPTT